jgi:4,5-DOPA dioxygenase extradiol
MYPDADVPVLQISLPSLDPRALMELGRKLRPLRDEGVLIIGSGFFTHNLAALREVSGTDDRPPSWSAEFDEWGAEMLRTNDIDALLDFRHKAPAAGLAHPRIEHFAPLFVSLGAGIDDAEPETVIDGYWYGLAKRSIRLG